MAQDSEPNGVITRIDKLARALLELEIQLGNGSCLESEIDHLKKQCEDAYVLLQEDLGDERAIKLLAERIPVVRQRYVVEELLPICDEGRVASDPAHRREIFAKLETRTGKPIYGGDSLFSRSVGDWTDYLILKVPQPSLDLLRA